KAVPKKPAPVVENLEVLDDVLTPLDDGLGDPFLSNSAALEATSPLMGPAKPSGGLASLFGLGPPAKNKSPWDSMLIYVGGGALTLLILAFVVLYLTLARGSASEAFKLAEDDFHQSADSQAIAKYEKYLASYSNDENASLARVRIGICQIRMAVKGSNDWKKTLKSTGEILQRIEPEVQFDQARTELADLLPQIATAFVTEARRSTGDIPKARELVEQTELALELVNNGAYIPPILRGPVDAKVAAIQEEVSFVKREINRDTELQTALGSINKAIEAGQPSEAYAIRRTLLKQYPGLDVNEQLVQGTLAITAKCRELVQASDHTLVPLDSPPAPVVSEVVLTEHTGSDVANLTGQMASFVLSGSAYGVDAGSGRVIWRQTLGAGNNFQPVKLSEQGASDFLMRDRRTHDLLRVSASDGKVLWRLPLAKAFFAPIMLDKRAVVTHDESVLLVDSETGKSQRQAHLPQAAVQSAAHDPRRPQLYQLGDHSNLYVLSAEDLSCREVFFVGHQEGAIAVPPVVVGGQIFVANNVGADYSLVHLIASDAEGVSLKKLQDPVRLQGCVVTPPVVDGRRVYFVTNLGAVHVFDVDPANTKEPVTVVAKVTAARQQPLVSYAAVSEGRAWLADERLTMYELQPAKGDLARRWSQFDGDTFLAAPQRIGTTLLHARRRRGQGDLMIAAVSATDGKLQWQTSIAVPVLSLIKSDSAVLATNAQGAQYTIAKPGVIDAPTTRAPIAASWSQATSWNDTKLALANAHGDPQWAVVEPGSVKAAKFAEAVALQALPQAFGEGLLLPLANGQLALADAVTGKPLLFPFQARQAADLTSHWRQPLVVNGASPAVIAADDQKHLYYVARQEQPRPHLAALHSIDLTGDIVAPLALLDENTVVVALKEPQEQLLQAYALPDFKVGARLPLTGQILYGPTRVGGLLLLATATEGLVGIDAELKVRWKFPLEEIALRGAPLLLGNGDLLLITTSGSLLRVNSNSGALIKRLETGHALGAEAKLIGNRLYLAGQDGAVYVLPLTTLDD
ncbi:MAG TPA: PQQ-binding-like beta-propeller repeat protein, partial [Pirellulaceae bacterium]|nr:PQQ-binding-like beta-propeller repeat protein [Pirellulaceae bacterium]